MSLKKLLSAIDDDELDAAKALLAKGLDPNPKPKQVEDGVPLVHALAVHRLEFAELILAHGAKPDLAGEHTPLITVIRSPYFDDPKQQLAWVERLHAAGADLNLPSDGMTPLGHALEREAPLLVDWLLAHDVSLEDPPESKPLFFLAVAAKHSALCLRIIDAGFDPNTEDEEAGYLPLCQAIFHGLDEVAERLLQKGADLTRTTEYDSPLASAIEAGRLAWAERLLASKIDPDWTDHNDHGYFVQAAGGKSAAILKALHTAGYDGNSIDALYRATISHDNTEIIDFLVEVGAPTQRDLLSLVSIAIYNDHPATVARLLPGIEDKNAFPDPTWRTPGGSSGRPANFLLNHAIERGLVGVVKLLLAAGADPSRPLPQDARTVNNGVLKAGMTSRQVLDVVRKERVAAHDPTAAIDEIAALLDGAAGGKPKPKR